VLAQTRVRAYCFAHGTLPSKPKGYGLDVETELRKSGYLKLDEGTKSYPTYLGAHAIHRTLLAKADGYTDFLCRNPCRACKPGGKSMLCAAIPFVDVFWKKGFWLSLTRVFCACKELGFPLQGTRMSLQPGGADCSRWAAISADQSGQDFG
jgi:hypothetical protein